MLLRKSISLNVAALAVLMLAGCGSESLEREGQQTSNKVETPAVVQTPPTPSELLTKAIITASKGAGTNAFILPDSDDWDAIPQDPNNPLSAEKVLLGKMLFHETALSTQGVNANLNGTWSCASCHHADAGFKSGIPQGIGEGGEGFGQIGSKRILVENFDKDSQDPSMVPDVQPLTSPSILNTAYQDVMLWNGQFGNAVDGIINNGLPLDILTTANTPKKENSRNLSGLEVQAIAGTAVHRLKTSEDSIVQTNQQYIEMFEQAFPSGSDDVSRDAGKAIAAFERTVLANQAPFQAWLKGDLSAMSNDEIAGATLFFGDAGCAACHNGPGLSSALGASEDEVFFAIGFADFNPNNPQITGTVDEASSKGRGGFTQRRADDYKFKVPQLYNLKDTNVFGHGASFSTIRDVVAYKNAGVSQQMLPQSTLDPRFIALGLTPREIDQITVFLEKSLYDPNLRRYVPTSTPSGNCVTVNDETSKKELGC